MVNPVAVSDPITGNSYVTPVEVKAYFELTDPKKSRDWFPDSESDDQFCINATIIIDQSYNFIGWRTTTVSPFQPLEWPRREVPRDGKRAVSQLRDNDTPFSLEQFVAIQVGESTIPEKLDEDTLPQFLKDATAELALELKKTETANQDLYALESNTTRKKVKVGSLEVENFDKNDTFALGNGIIKAATWAKLQKYGTYTPAINITGFVSAPAIG